MPASHTEVYVHFVWTTWNRRPQIPLDEEDRLYDYIRTRCRDLHAHLIAIGGVSDHIHLLIRMPTTISISKVVSDIKGSSSHFATRVLNLTDFRWQSAYGAFSVATETLDIVTRYIENQKSHHSQQLINKNWEPTNSE